MSTSFWARLDDLMGLSSTGDDAVAWWQGQTTQDVAAWSVGQVGSTCLVTPTGQLAAIVRGQRTEQGFHWVTEAAEVLLERVRDYVILEDVNLTVSGVGGVTIQGPLAEDWIEQQGITGDAGPLPFGGFAIRQRRCAFGGWDLVGIGDPEELPVLLPGDEVEPEDVFAEMLRAGIPQFGVDTHSKLLPPELGPEFEREHISYTKGCYTGQEVLQRLHSRGHTNRTWVLVQLQGPVLISEPVMSDQNERIGSLTQLAPMPDDTLLAGAFLKNDYAMVGTPVRVADQLGEVISPESRP